MRLETERLILDAIRETDKEDYFVNVSHDKKAWLAERFADGLVFLKSVERGKCFIEYLTNEQMNEARFLKLAGR